MYWRWGTPWEIPWRTLRTRGWCWSGRCVKRPGPEGALTGLPPRLPRPGAARRPGAGGGGARGLGGEGGDGAGGAGGGGGGAPGGEGPGGAEG